MTVVEEKINEMLDEPCWESKPYLIGMDKIGVADVMERFAEWDEQRIVGRAVEWLEKYLFYLDKRDDVIENFKQYVLHHDNEMV